MLPSLRRLAALTLKTRSWFNRNQAFSPLGRVEEAELQEQLSNLFGKARLFFVHPATRNIPAVGAELIPMVQVRASDP